MPAMHQASGRLASTVMSKTASGSIPRASAGACPGRPRRRVEDQQAGAVVGQAELPARAQHPVRRHSPHLAPADLEAAREHGADRGQRDQVAHREVHGAADDLDGSPPASTTTRRIRSAPSIARSPHPGHHDVVEPLAHPLDPLDDQAEVVERRPRAATSPPKGAKSRSQERGAHESSSRVRAQNWGRKRTSFSIRARMSGMRVAHLRQAVDAEAEGEPGPPSASMPRRRTRPGRPCRSRPARPSPLEQVRHPSPPQIGR